MRSIARLSKRPQHPIHHGLRALEFIDGSRRDLRLCRRPQAHEAAARADFEHAAGRRSATVFMQRPHSMVLSICAASACFSAVGSRRPAPSRSHAMTHWLRDQLIVSISAANSRAAPAMAGVCEARRTRNRGELAAPGHQLGRDGVQRRQRAADHAAIDADANRQREAEARAQRLDIFVGVPLTDSRPAGPVASAQWSICVARWPASCSAVGASNTPATQ